MRVGLCENCRHVKVLQAPSGSVFYMCQRAEYDRRFRRYPPLPVVQCEGYEEKVAEKDEERQ